MVLYCLMLPLLATLADIRLLAASLFVFGMGIGLADVAMNVQGTLVEQAADKPLMSGFHCLWSVGGIAGAGGGALLLGAGSPRRRRPSGHRRVSDSGAGTRLDDGAMRLCSRGYWRG